LTIENSAQTNWRYPKNAATQYEPRYMNEAEQKQALDKNQLSEFLNRVLPELENFFILLSV
jgi:dynein intermediate chain 3, axonemal